MPFVCRGWIAPWLLAGLAAASPARADRNALWNIVHGQCAAHAQANQGPAPCVDVDLSQGEDRGVALLKDIHGVAQELAIPTRRVAGVEDPWLLSPEAPNYFAYAWRERAELEKTLKHPLAREAVGVSVNSSHARSQDQLHLHVDCMDAGVAAVLAGYVDALDDVFRPMTVKLNGRTYWARRLAGAELGARSPFQLLAEGVAGARADMGLWTLIVVGASFKGEPGFVLLADHAELWDGGHAEDLQDHDCKISPPA